MLITFYSSVFLRIIFAFSLYLEGTDLKRATQRVALNSRYDKLGFPDIIH